MSILQKVLIKVRSIARILSYETRLTYSRLKSTYRRQSIHSGAEKSIVRVNLCNGGISVPNFFSTDIRPDADLYLDLEKELLPFPDNSLEYVVCISSINYFTRDRGEEIIQDTYRALRPGGVARFAVQDLRMIADKYIRGDREFFYQKRTDGSGRDRFPGETMADKINTWFYGYASRKGTGGRYFYDYETLALLFKKAGFAIIEERRFQDSRIPHIDAIDNRPDQMFFLEAVK